MLETSPDWNGLVRNGVIAESSARILAMMSSLSDTSSLKDLITAHPEVMNNLINLTDRSLQHLVPVSVLLQVTNELISIWQHTS